MRLRRAAPRLLPLLAGLLLTLTGPGCGGPSVGGSGTLRATGEGGPGDHLVLAGTPYEQGWWHGHVLRPRILALHEAWQRAAFAEDGDLASPDSQERRRLALLLVDPVLPLLPESVRRELEGLSDGSGLPVRTLLLTELLTDVLRFTEDEPRLLGGLVMHDLDEHAVLLGLHGPFAALVEPALLWITRPAAAGQPPVTVLAWPGSLGALVAGRSDGLAAALAEAPRKKEEQVLRGVPMKIALRLAAERAVSAATLLALLPRTTGHDVVAWDLREPRGLEQQVAHVGGEPHAWPVDDGVFSTVGFRGQPELVPDLAWDRPLSAFGLRRRADVMQAWWGPPCSRPPCEGRSLRLP